MAETKFFRYWQMNFLNVRHAEYSDFFSFSSKLNGKLVVYIFRSVWKWVSIFFYFFKQYTNEIFKNQIVKKLIEWEEISLPDFFQYQHI